MLWVLFIDLLRAKGFIGYILYYQDSKLCIPLALSPSVPVGHYSLHVFYVKQNDGTNTT